GFCGGGRRFAEAPAVSACRALARNRGDGESSNRSDGDLRLLVRREQSESAPPIMNGGATMINESKRQFARVLAVFLSCGGVAAAQGNSPTQLRQFVDQQVGGIQKLMVPSHNADLPQPRLADGRPDPQFQTTEAKRYLGTLLFHEPARATRIIPEFGGILADAGTASCGTCHLGEAASKAGTLLNFATGAEGRGYTDAEGNFIARRRPLPNLPILRQTPLFPGDALVDELPTLTDIYLLAGGTTEVNTPARGRRPLPGDITDTRPRAIQLLATGRLDALDSVARNPLSIIGAAFNNR